MKTFNISCLSRGSDAELFTKVINMGIDSHLQAFTESKFNYVGHRLEMNFARSELPILLRRLREVETEHADLWADDIEESLKNE